VARSVLIVDDDEGFRGVARELLGQRGYMVVGSANGAAEARTRVAELDPDVVLLDVKLLDGDGVALADELAGIRAGRPSILLTSSDPLAVPEHVLACSAACGFLAKTELVHADLDRYLEP
jgi:DNA-binding NarL/FixJ family response regulator